jgi:hypothetical protein
MMTKSQILRGDVNAMLGSFRIAAPTGAVTVVAAGGHLLAMQWTSATVKARLRYLAARFVTSTAFGAAQEVGVNAFVGRAFSAPDTGGTAIPFTTNQQKMASSLSASACADARVATTAALGAGTVTLDTTPFASTSGWSGGVGATIAGADVVMYDARSQYDQNGLELQDPIVFGQNEGLVLTNAVLMGATGVGRWQFSVEWQEVTP